jgi:DNA topoisomerase-2
LILSNFFNLLTTFQVDRWEVSVAASEGTPQSVSFVNSICTSKGGTHVSYIADQVANHLVKVLKKRKKISDAKPSVIKNCLAICVNCLVENPTFDSQTKEHLTSKKSTFGSKCELSPAFLKKLEKGDFINSIESFLSFKQGQQLKRMGGKKTVKLRGIDKLDDANFAGTAKSAGCTLILTEGDSAKSLAMAGIAVVGRDYYGCFPLKGKLLNVRDATMAVIQKNEEIKRIVDIMGLKFNTTYDQTNVKTLRYGHLMIMSDQDVDGSHIKGLVINFIHRKYFDLLIILNSYAFSISIYYYPYVRRVLAWSVGPSRLSETVYYADCQSIQGEENGNILHSSRISDLAQTRRQ